MEHIKPILQSFRIGTHIPGPKTFEEENPNREQMLEQLRLSLRVSSLDHTFKNFRKVPGTANALRAFRELAKGSSGKLFLLCYGGVGNGKTYLCEALVIELYKQGKFTRLSTMGEIMRTLKGGMEDYATDPHGVLLERFCTASRLIVDDVGMGGSGSVWEYGQLEEIVVFRYRERLLTVLTTNREPKELPERIVSRFLDPEVGICVLNEGGDYRKSRKVEAKAR